MSCSAAGPSTLNRSASRQSQSTLSRVIYPSPRDLDSEFAFDDHANAGAIEGEEGVQYVLLAEFDIDAGATLSHQYPYPTGTEEHRLAELMLPDGAHLRTEDWTVFYLGQTPSSAINPVFTHEAGSDTCVPGDHEPVDNTSRHSVVSATISHRLERKKRGVPGGGLLYVLNCVRQKEDKSMRRGAMVKALAVCSPNPYIQIYKPLLLLAMEEYFTTGSVDTLAKLYDCCNSISTYGMPKFSRNEKILLRQNEQKDLLVERYLELLEPASAEVQEEERLDDEDGSTNRSASIASGRDSKQGHVLPRKLSAGSTQTQGTSLRAGRGIKGVPRDTRTFETEAHFASIKVPIRIPMTVFDEDVGDYSMIEFFKAFSQDSTPFAPPFAPYLHTNGAHTHPIILILNAMLAHKRVVFLGTQMPANIVARMVLAACALSTASGQVLGGVTESAFPYANLASLDIFEQFSGYVAGVTNPRFGDLTSTWDVLCDVESGKVVVSKDIKGSTVGTLRSGRSSESSLPGSFVKVDENDHLNPGKVVSIPRSECIDNQFVEEVLVAINSHFGESHVRQRVYDHLTRFVRLASHHEFSRDGTSTIGFPSRAYSPGKLGCGMFWPDNITRTREVQANMHRIEAWKRTKSYKICQADWKRFCRETTFDFDLGYQVLRLRFGRNMPDTEAEEIFSSIARSLGRYEQVVELLTHFPGQSGGLLPLANGLLHRYPGVREAAADILLSLQHYPVGRQAVSTMNYFHRKTFLHLLERREKQEELHREFADRVRVQ